MAIAVGLALSLVPSVAAADITYPDPRSAFASWTPSQQWMPVHGNQHDRRADYGYGTRSGALLLADELSDHFSELGRASLVQVCLGDAEPSTKSALMWALCGPDAKALDLNKLAAELDADHVAGKDAIVREATEVRDQAMKVGEIIDRAAADDPGLKDLLSVADRARAEWSTYVSAHKDSFAQYLALKDGVRAGKSNDHAFAGCWEKTQPAMAKLVKTVAPTVPPEVGGDALPTYMSYATTTTEGYITAVSFAACAWSVGDGGEAAYAAAANRENGALRAGWRTLALAKILDAGYKPRFADRSLRLADWTFDWKSGVKMKGVNDTAAIMTPQVGVIGTLKPEGDMVKVGFKGNQVEECLEWETTNRVKQVVGSSVSYEKVCKRRGMVANQTTEATVAANFMAGAKPGDTITIVAGFPVVVRRGNRLTALLGIAL